MATGLGSNDKYDYDSDTNHIIIIAKCSVTNDETYGFVSLQMSYNIVNQVEGGNHYSPVNIYLVNWQ